MLSAAVLKHEARSLRVFDQRAALGHHCRRFYRVSLVMHQDSAQSAALGALAHEYGDAVERRVKNSLPQQGAGERMTELVLAVLERPLAGRHRVEVDAEDGKRHRRAQRHRRRRQPRVRRSRCAQRHEFRIRDHAAIHGDRRDERRHRQDDRQNRRQGQRR